MIRNERPNSGGAYMMVLVVMLATFAMLIMLIGITSYEMKVTAAYGNYANLYTMSASAAENALRILNSQLVQSMPVSTAGETLVPSVGYSLEPAVFERLGGLNQANLLEYMLPPSGDVYAGEFRIKNKSSTDEYIKAFRESAITRINSSLASSLDTTAEGYKMENIIDTGVSKYETITEICPQNTFGQDVYVVTSVTRRLDSEAQSTALGRIRWSEDIQEIVLIPTYKWKTVSTFFTYAVTTVKEVVAIGTELPSEIFCEAAEDFGEIVNNSITLPPTVWSEDNPVMIVYSSDHIDVSTLYRNDVPVPTILINQGSGQLELYASDDARNQFHGVVSSRNGLTLTSVAVTGNILTGDDVVLSGSAVHADPDMIFKIRLSDRQLEKRLLDYLRITDFASKAGSGDTSSVLKNAALGEHFSLEIRGLELTLEMEALKEI